MNDGVRVHRISATARRVDRFFTTPSRRWAPPVPDHEAVAGLRSVLADERHGHDWLARSYLPVKRRHRHLPALVMSRALTASCSGSFPTRSCCLSATCNETRARTYCSRPNRALSEPPPLVLIGRCGPRLRVSAPPAPRCYATGQTLPKAAMNRRLALLVPSLWPEPFGVVFARRSQPAGPWWAARAQRGP